MRHGHRNTEQRRNQVQVAQPWPGFSAKERLPSKNQTGEDADDQYACACIAEQQDIGHGLTPVCIPVPGKIPAERPNCENSENSVEDQSPLGGRVEGAEGDGKSRNKLEEKKGPYPAGQSGGPRGPAVYWLSAIQVRLNLVERSKK